MNHQKRRLIPKSLWRISDHRYDIKGKAYIETPKKYYFSDLGLRSARLNFRQFEPTHSMENVIYNELRMRGYSVDVGVVSATKKNKNGKVIRQQYRKGLG